MSEKNISICLKCDSKVLALGLCSKHYQEQKRREKGISKKQSNTCYLCDRPAAGHGLCLMHYKRQIRRNQGKQERPKFDNLQDFFAFWSEKMPNGCIEWKSKSPRYPRAKWGDKYHLVHRLSYTFHKGAIPEEMCVCHTCDNTFCINPDHLFLGSHKENMLDKCKKNRSFTKLNTEQVIAILNDKRKQKDIAKDYNVSQTTISEIKTKKLWRHISS